MKRLDAFLAASLLLSSGLTAGCNVGPALLRVVEINRESSSGGATARSSVEVSYTREGQLDEVENRTDGDFTSRYEYSYEAGKLSEIELLFDGSEPLVLEVTWTGALLTGMRAERDGRSDEVELEYENNDASRVVAYNSETRSEGYTSRTETSFEYDDKSRLAEINSESSSEISGQQTGSYSTESKFEYGNEGRPEKLETLVRQSGETELFESEFSYDERGRLEETDEDDGVRYSYTYDDEGRLIEVEQTGNGVTVLTEYVYEDGTTDGFAPLLGEGSGLFDLTGRHLERVPVYSSLTLPSL